ncbi:MAG: nucleoside deaminase, partial [Clostridiales bacterium]|nr:nucleoside deaminase [Clostridiales bacterium]
CPMCAGAIINARIPSVVIGTRDPKGGAFGSVINLNDFSWNHHPKVTFGIMEAECAAVLTDFFKQRRAAGPRWKKKQL